MYQSVDPPSDRPVILPSHCSSAQQRRRKDFKVPGVGAAPPAAFNGHDQTTGRKWQTNYNSEIECLSFTVLLLNSLSVNEMISNIDIFPILKHMCCHHQKYQAYNIKITMTEGQTETQTVSCRQIGKPGFSSWKWFLLVPYSVYNSSGLQEMD